MSALLTGFLSIVGAAILVAFLAKLGEAIAAWLSGLFDGPRS